MPAIMAGHVIAGHGKKLIVIGLFLVLVLILVGGEDDPGVIGGLADADAPVVAEDELAVAQTPSPPPPARREDPALSSWYSQSADSGAAIPQPVVPTPVDDSHLINDAKPMVSVGPPTAPSGPTMNSPDTAVIE
tara:strand:+ start:54 stop:455 length:402 start_codon:yes stop_codon:yes gene_type:complete